MEVHGRQPGKGVPPAHEHRQEAFRATQERIREARELLNDLSRQRQDRLRTERERSVSDHVEASERAQSRRTEEARDRRTQDVVDLSAAAEAVSSQRDARARHVEEVRAAMIQGTLDSPERLERAAQRLLGGEES